MKQPNLIVRAQIGHLQQAIWDLDKVRANVQKAIGASDLGKCYIESVDELKTNLQDDIDNLWDNVNNA